MFSLLTKDDPNKKPRTQKKTTRTTYKVRTRKIKPNYGDDDYCEDYEETNWDGGDRFGACGGEEEGGAEDDEGDCDGGGDCDDGGGDCDDGGGDCGGDE